MSRNEQILIDQIINQEYSSNGSYKNINSFFELYSASQILKNHDLSYDEIESGICGDTLDGGVDSLYLFINGELIEEDTDITEKFKRNVTIELVIIQSKNETSFSETPIIKLEKVSSNLLKLDFNPADYEQRYNQELLKKFCLFKDAYLKLITKRPELKIKYYYVSKGVDVHPNVKAQIEELKQSVKRILCDAEVTFTTIGASELLAIYRKKDNQVFTLNLAENPLSSQGKVFISLAKLKDYYDFITNNSDEMLRYIFESNVRDYQGKTNVNQDIQKTLRETSSQEDFWWLNNGVTILADDVSAPGGKKLIINNPEIVNGLQTSTEIYLHFKNSAQELSDDDRALLVRVIVPENEESRDRIIRATNSQTPIPKASLRATDAIHRDIEDYLKARNMFYDRRKNYYKNLGKKPCEIISLPFLAQCVMAIALQKPNFSRARPSTLLEDDASYRKLYSESNPVKGYYIAALIGRTVESLLKEQDYLSTSARNNIKFYVVYAISVLITKNLHPGFRALDVVTPDVITKKIQELALKIVLEEYKNLGATDQVAKGKDLISALKDKLRENIEQ